jgi:hypothetical protein
LGVAMLILKFASDRWDIAEPKKLYDMAKAPT